jgi:hypothetical protein
MRSPAERASRKSCQTAISTPRVRIDARPRSSNPDAILAGPTRESHPVHQRRIFLRAKKEANFNGEIWQKGYNEQRIKDAHDYTEKAA